MAVLGVALSVTAAAALLLGVWRNPAPDPVPAAAPVIQVGEGGNGRPVVSYDGLMVRRCTAVAVYPAVPGSAPAVRRALRAAGARAGLALVDVPPDVLSPATLQRQVPEVVDCVPPGTDTARLLARPLPGEDHHLVESVLVHDLAFTVRPTGRTPAALAAALDREGILADSLGRYDVRVAGPALRILYTGLLLGDDEVTTVRAAIARWSGGAAVTVGPRSPTGPGVRLADEPPPAPALPDDAHHH
jgi:hypothetical protein